jgi:hypothetical protein
LEADDLDDLEVPGLNAPGCEATTLFEVVIRT